LNRFCIERETTKKKTLPNGIVQASFKRLKKTKKKKQKEKTGSVNAVL
jgi:hypothetical protein